MRIASLLLALTITLKLLTLPLTHAAPFSSRITTGELFRYTFEEGQLDDNVATTVDTGSQGIDPLGHLILNPAACSLLLDRPGALLPGTATQQAGISEQDQTGILNSIKSKKVFSMEAWFKPATFQQTNIIFGFGGWNTTTPKERTACFAEPISYEFHQDGANFGGNQAMGTSNSKACSTEEDFVGDLALTHVVITYAVNGTSFLYINGEYNGAHTKVYTWYPYWDSSHKLYLTPDLDRSSFFSWKGSIHLISMYNRNLSLAEVQTNYAAGLPNAKPQPSPRLTTLSGFEETMSQYALKIDATDYDGVNGAAQSLQILSFPSKGTFQLRTASGWITFTSSSPAWTIDTNRSFPLDIQYTPSSGSGSSFDGLSFTGLDEFGSGRTGFVSFNILPKPIPRNITSIANIGIPYSGVVMNAENLGNFAELANVTVRATLLTLPTVGKLYQTLDGVNTTGAALKSSDLPITVLNTQGHIVYISTESDLPSGQSYDGMTCYLTTSFTYALKLEGGPQSSQNGNVDVQVCSRVQVFPSSVVVSAVESRKSVTVTGSSLLAGEKVALTIRSLPKYGKLVRVVSASNLTVSQVSLKIGDDISEGKIEYRRALDLTTSLQPVLVATEDSFNFSASTTSGAIKLYSPSAVVKITLTPPTPDVGAQSTSDMIKDPNVLAAYLFDGSNTVTPVAAGTVVDSSTVGLGGNLAFSPTTPSLVRYLDYTAQGLLINTSSSTDATLIAAQTQTNVDALYVRMYQKWSIEMWISLDAASTFSSTNASAPVPTGMIFSLGKNLTNFDLSFSQVYASPSQGTKAAFRIALGPNVEPIEFPASVDIQMNTPISSTASGPDQAQAEYTRTKSHFVIIFDPRVPTVITYHNGSVIDFNLKQVQLPAPVVGDLQKRKLSFGKQWNGILHQFNIYERVLPSTEIQARYTAGLQKLRSSPVPLMQDIPLTEFVGGEIVGGSDVGTNAMFAVKTADGNTAADAYIVSLPSAGTLAVRNTADATGISRALTIDELPYYFDTTLITSGALSFIYTPPTGSFSGTHAASFQWTTCLGQQCARTTVTPASSNKGTVYLNIVPTITPPLAGSASLTLPEMKLLQVPFSGTDRDQHSPVNAPMEAYWIDTIPAASNGKVFLSSSATPITPDYSVVITANMLPLRIAVGVKNLFFVGTVQIPGGQEQLDIGSITYRAEVKGMKGTSAEEGKIKLTLTRHLISTDLAVPVISGVPRVPLTFSGISLSPNTGADSFLPTSLDLQFIGESFPNTQAGAASSSVLDQNTNACYLVLDDSFALPIGGGLVHGLDAQYVTSTSAAGVTIFLQRWLLSSVGTSGKLISTSSLLAAGVASARRWVLAKSEWWNVSATDAPLTRFAVCVAGGIHPFRVMNSTSGKVMAQIPFTSSLNTLANIPQPGNALRRQVVVDVRVMIFSHVSLSDVNVPLSWPSINKVLSVSEIVSLLQPVRVWERTSLVLVKRLQYGKLVARNDASVLADVCPATSALPCILPAEGVDYLRPGSVSDPIQTDTFSFALTSSVSLKDIASVLSSAVTPPSDDDTLSYTSAVSITTLSDRSLNPPTFSLLDQVQKGLKPTKPGSDEGYAFSFALTAPIVMSSDGNTTTNLNTTGMYSYRVSLFVTPTTGGFRLPNGGSLVPTRVQFTLGSITGNSEVAFLASDIDALNLILKDALFSPLYPGEYNMTCKVWTRLNENDGGESVNAAIATYEFTVDKPDAITTETGGGSDSFLSSSNMVYLWIALAVAAFLCIVYLGYRIRKSRQAAAAQEKKRMEREATKIAHEEESQKQSQLLNTLVQISANNMMMMTNTGSQKGGQTGETSMGDTIDGGKTFPGGEDHETGEDGDSLSGSTWSSNPGASNHSRMGSTAATPQGTPSKKKNASQFPRGSGNGAAPRTNERTGERTPTRTPGSTLSKKRRDLASTVPATPSRNGKPTTGKGARRDLSAQMNSLAHTTPISPSQVIDLETGSSMVYNPLLIASSSSTAAASSSSSAAMSATQPGREGEMIQMHEIQPVVVQQQPQPAASVSSTAPQNPFTPSLSASMVPDASPQAPPQAPAAAVPQAPPMAPPMTSLSPPMRPPRPTISATNVGQTVPPPGFAAFKPPTQQE